MYRQLHNIKQEKQIPHPVAGSKKQLIASAALGIGLMLIFVYKYVKVTTDHNIDSGFKILDDIPLFIVAATILFIDGAFTLAKARNRRRTHRPYRLIVCAGIILLVPALSAIGFILVAILIGYL